MAVFIVKQAIIQPSTKPLQFSTARVKYYPTKLDLFFFNLINHQNLRTFNKIKHPFGRETRFADAEAVDKTLNKQFKMCHNKRSNKKMNQQFSRCTSIFEQILEFKKIGI